MHSFAAATQEYPALLDAVARSLAEVIGDACALFGLSEDGEVLALAAHQSPHAEVVRDSRAVLAATPMKVASRPAWQRVLLTGEPLLVPKVSLEAYAADSAPAFVDLLARTGVHSSLVVALRLHGRSIGLLALSRFRTDSGPYDEADCELAETIAEHAALAIGSARAYAAERAKADLMREQARLGALVEASDEAIIGKSLDGIITTWNHGAEATFGYSAAEVIGRSIRIIVPPGRESEESEILEALARGEGRRFETVRRRKDGKDIDVSVTTSPLRDPSGKVIGVSKVARDITERRRAAAIAAHARDAALTERLRAATDLAQVGLVVVGPDHRYRYANRSYAEMFGQGSADLVGQRIADVLPSVYESQIRPRLERAFGGERVSYELSVPSANGAEDARRYTGSYEPGVEAGAPIVVVVVVDMTDRKRVVEALAQREEQLSLFIAHSPAALAMFDQEMRYLGASRRWLADYGLSEDIVGRCHYDVIPTVPERWKETHRRALAGAVERSEDDSFLLPDGRSRWLRWEVRPWHTARGAIGGIVIFTEDITDRKKADLALRESEERFREMAENIRDAFWVTSASKREMLYVSPAYETIWGRSCASLYASPHDWLEAVHPEDRDRIKEAARTRQAIDAFQETYRVVRPDGTVRWVHDRAFPIRTPAGELVRYVGVVSDITKERTLEDQFRQAQKMEAVGRLAGGVAHDFNNMLSVILSYADLLLGTLETQDPIHADVAEIRKAGQRASELTRQLLQFSRQQLIEPKVFELSTVLSGMQRMLGRLIGEDVELTLALGSGGRVFVDPGGIEQVVMNLLVNARDAMPTGGSIRIETSDVVFDEAYARDHVAVKAGPYVALAVTDNGCGMDEATQAQIFEPFFTTKEKGKGTGLGLSTVFGIVTQSGGSVVVESRRGAGTTFRVLLPRVDAASGVRGASAAPATLRGTETILLVEDDAQVRAVARGILKRKGYTVLDARNGAEGIALSEGYQGTIHLLLTDVVMPQMSGPEVARRIVVTRPDMRVLCMSGYTDDSAVRHGILEAGSAFLHKPFTPESLAVKVREVLDAPRA